MRLIAIAGFGLAALGLFTIFNSTSAPISFAACTMYIVGSVLGVLLLQIEIVSRGQGHSENSREQHNAHPAWVTTASWGWSRQVQRGTIHHINPISASRMRLVPTPIRNNPTSACMSHQSASTLFEIIAQWARFLSMPWEARTGVSRNPGSFVEVY